MKKLLECATITLLTVYLATGSLFAQNTSHDSIAKIGTADGKKVRLDATERKRFKADRNNYTSDLFKPNPGLVSDTTLLKDSVYVKAFRMTAYTKAYKRRTIAHYVLIGGVVYGILTIVVVSIAILILVGKA